LRSCSCSQITQENSWTDSIAYEKNMLDDIPRRYGLAFHFTSKPNEMLITGASSLGLRASEVGQHAGGLSVSALQLSEFGWEPYCGGDFRQNVGRKLWGKKWQDVMPNGPHANKLQVAIAVKVPLDILNKEEHQLEGRAGVVIIPPMSLYASQRHHYLSKDNIVRVLYLEDDE